MPNPRVFADVANLSPRRAQGQVDMLTELEPSVSAILTAAAAGDTDATAARARLLAAFVEARIDALITVFPGVQLPEDAPTDHTAAAA